MPDSLPAARNRRAAYRVEPVAPEAALEVLAQRQRLVRTEIADVAVGGARVELEDDALAEVDLGRRLDLSLHCQRHDYAARVSATVVSTRSNGQRTSLGLRFDAATPPLDAAGADIFRLFNRRAYRRRAPRDDVAGHAFDACISLRERGADPAATWPVGISDLSNVGVSLVGDAAAHRELESVGRFDLSLKLPRQNTRTTFACIVHYRAVSDGQVRYGCEYDWSETLDRLSAAEDLAAYVIDGIETPPG